MRNMILGAAAATMVVPAALTVPMAGAAAEAQSRYDRYDSRYSRYYDNRGYYNGPTWRGRDGRYYCRRSNGTTGLIVGGAAGALAGRAIDTRGERTTGTIIGALAGALIGREIQRSSGNRCR